VVGIAAVVVLVIAAGINANRSGAGADVRTKLTVIAPAAPGGGWDLVAREAQQALRADGIINNVAVNNIPGAGGTIGLSTIARMEGEPTIMMVTGTVMMGGITRNDSPTKLDQLTPIARLAQDFEVIAVPKDSEFKTLDDFFAAWRENPKGIPIGGGSAGGIDHMVAAQMARVADVNPADLEYAAYAGGGELTINLLSTAPGTVEVGISGYNDFRDLLTNGSLRALAVVAPDRLEGLDAPTMTELGFDEVDLVNWRGLVAPAGLSAEQRAELTAIVEEMVGTQSWQAAVTRNRWQEWVLTGDEFGEFLTTEQERIDVILKDLGLA
jgi:putative tricarboxylic transport membrane protein